MYYNNIKINYLIKDERGVIQGGSSTLEGAEKIKKDRELDYEKLFSESWGKLPVLNIEKI